MKKTSKLKGVLKLALAIGLILIALTACERPPEAPIQVTDVSVHPNPLIGRTATVQIEIASSRDERDVTITVTLPSGVKLMSGELGWRGSLKANQPQTHEFSICAMYQGDWRVEVIAASNLPEGGSYSDVETVHLIVSENTARVVPGDEYRFIQPPGGVPPSTPLPEVSPSVCLDLPR